MRGKRNGKFFEETEINYQSAAYRNIYAFAHFEFRIIFIKILRLNKIQRML